MCLIALKYYITYNFSILIKISIVNFERSIEGKGMIRDQ